MSVLKLGPAAVVNRFASRLRFPHLFWITFSLFVLDVLVPDFIPFADEILLALLSLLFASWRKRGADTAPPEEPEIKNVTPRPPAPREP
jgi:Family of unknown function (DUF6116)